MPREDQAQFALASEGGLTSTLCMFSMQYLEQKSFLCWQPNMYLAEVFGGVTVVLCYIYDLSTVLSNCLQGSKNLECQWISKSFGAVWDSPPGDADLEPAYGRHQWRHLRQNAKR